MTIMAVTLSSHLIVKQIKT